MARSGIEGEPPSNFVLADEPMLDRFNGLARVSTYGASSN